MGSFIYNRLGKDAVETDAEEIIDMAGKASLADQQKQVQENVHSQITSFCKYMDHILQPDLTVKDKQGTPSSENNSSPRHSGLSFAIGRTAPLKDHSVMAIKRRGEEVLGGLYTGINTKHIFTTRNMVEEYSGLKLQPHKAIVGPYGSQPISLTTRSHF
ncbi:hypothetical protein KY284_010596 [Solanum tuberosum]|nr:hypothetical protein KY284_010596 [Solanum tuberosum]